MTLIIAAICKNGVFIRSDKRRKVINASGSIDCYDDMEKVFVSPDKRTIIYNHGINIINGKSWYDLAVKSAKHIRQNSAWKIDRALDIIENTISADVLEELSNNQFSALCAFVLILKTKGKKWRAGEISWERGQDVKKSPRTRFIRSGLGTKYLHPSNKQMKNAYWESIRIIEAKQQIGLLWANAIKNQSNAQGNEFSPSYDDVDVMVT